MSSASQNVQTGTQNHPCPEGMGWTASHGCQILSAPTLQQYNNAVAHSAQPHEKPYSDKPRR